MFGHDDNQHQDSVVEPEHDDILTSDMPLPASVVDEAPLPSSSPSTTIDDETPPSDVNTDAHNTNDLLRIKQEALRKLTPLVDHLNQTPEEKFRTTMMMIQASDDQGLVSQAYDAAKEISDDKTRAQALLDIINEINYFTAQHGLSS
jgi:hypothetical protein